MQFKPSEYQHRILYAVLGLSPQILTETLYALLHADEPFIPTEIHVLTTRRGEQHCRLALFKENGGWFHKFCQDFNLSGIQFSENHIHVLESETGEQLEDIRTPQENNDVANQITRQIKNFTSRNDTSLHVSIAGGRKTMGFYAGYALSIFGREQDRLSHVLVEPQFEGHPNFFYPTPYSSVIRTRDQAQILDVRDAIVDLAYLPFVRLRDSLNPNLLENSNSFNKLVGQLQHSFAEPSLLINTQTHELIIENQSIKLTPANFIFYMWMVERRLQGLPGIVFPPDEVPNETYLQDYINIQQKYEPMRDMERTLQSIQTGMTKDFIAQRKNGIKTSLTKVLGVNAKPFLIQVQRLERMPSHGLILKPEKIKLI